MTPHPARPFTDPADLRSELDDIDTLTRDVFGPDVPLRDRVATLVADWQDTTILARKRGAYRDRVDATERQYDRHRGLA